jgi:glycerol kinase
MQFQSDILDVPVTRPTIVETTALGAAYLAGLAVGFWRDRDQITNIWSIDRTFESQMSIERRDELYTGWKDAVKRSRSSETV